MAEEEAVFRLPPVPPDGTLTYGPHPDQVVDLYEAPPDPRTRPQGDGSPPDPADDGPPPAAAPLLVLLHGGFWRVAYDRRYLSPAAAALAREGWPVALVEYRRVGGGGGWPRTYQDVRAALAALAGRGRPLVLVGHSAGGHLALLAAADARHPQDEAEPARPHPALSHVIAVSPVADLARAHELNLSNGAVAAFLTGGAGPDGPPASPHPDGPIGPDPARNTPPTTPVTLLHGRDDPDVPTDLSHRYLRAVTRTPPDPAAPALRLHELTGVGHFAPVTPGTDAWRLLLAAIRST
ncbi:alpha/beta hydrolase fold domain-containing protein [Streptomyces sp. NPDC003077]|uniref:alpha/beta hydrolase fold domain-containing protein n=1 Tax=Streptomyces sp. NPDC003077 TaxID=3154443 RepID=UPI0033B6E43F